MHVHTSARRYISKRDYLARGGGGGGEGLQGNIMIPDKRLPREVVEGKNVIPDKIRSGTCVTQLGLSG
jgi:hypothetical protein